MGIKKNNLGQDGKITWGHLGKRKEYTNEAFKVIEVEKQNKKYNWQAKLKPWGGMDKGKLVIMMPATSTTPPPTTTTTTTIPTGQLWEAVSTNWESTTDNWNTI